MRFRILAFALCACSLAGCTTTPESNPPRSATEELLISSAAQRSADKLVLQIPKGTKVFVDNGNFEGTDSKFAVSAIHDSLLRQGAFLVDDKKNAQAIIEIRAGALSINKDEMLVGIPHFTAPIPLAGSALQFPEIALYKTAEQKGIAQFAFTAYDAKTGALLESQAPEFGLSHKTERTVLIFISWTSDDILPQDDNVMKRDLTAITPEK